MRGVATPCLSPAARRSTFGPLMPSTSFDPTHALRTVDPRRLGICTGEDDRIVDVNEAFERLSGFSRDEIVRGAIAADLISPTEWQMAPESSALSARRHGFCRPLLRQLVRRDGRRIDILISGAVTTEAPRRWLCFVVDVSAMAQNLGAAAASTLGLPPLGRHLREAPPLLVHDAPCTSAPSVETAAVTQRALLAAVLDAAPTGALVLGLHAQALHATPAACRSLGVAALHVLGQRWRDLVHPDDRAALDARLLLLLGGRRCDDDPPLATRWLHGHGHWHELDVQPVLIPEPTDCAVVLHLHDRAALRAAGQELQLEAAVRRARAEETTGCAELRYSLELDCLSAQGDAVAGLCRAVGVADADALARCWAASLALVRQGYETCWSVEGEGEATFLCRGIPLRSRTGALTGLLVMARRLAER